MTTFQRERAHDLWPEVMPLLQRNWEETAPFKDMPLNINQAAYNAMEDAGMLRCFTARVPELVAYAIFTVTPALRALTTIQATHDVLFVLPEYRKRSIGYRLVSFCDQQLRAEGVGLVLHQETEILPYGRMLSALGYRPITRTWAKRLDKE